MTKATPKQRTYGAGEWTEDLEGRDDLAGWWNSLRILKNWIAQVFGSATRRPGTDRFQTSSRYTSRRWTSLARTIGCPAY